LSIDNPDIYISDEDYLKMVIPLLSRNANKRRLCTELNRPKGPRLVIVFLVGIVHCMMALVVFSLSHNSARSHDKFEAIAKESAPAYHFDFARNFFSSAEAERAGRERYHTILRRLENLKGKVSASPGNLLLAMQLYDSVLVEFMRHYTYLYLRYAVNTQDRTSLSESSEIDADFSKRTAFIREELIRIDTRTLEKFARQAPALSKYSFAVRSAHRFQPHTLPLNVEEIFGAIAPFTSGWQYDLYVALLDRVPFGTIKTEHGELDVRRDRRVIASDENRSVREKGFKELYAGYASQRDLYAFVLIKLVESGNRLAQLHHFEDSPSETYFDRYWTKAEVSSLLTRIGQLSDVRKRYERLRAGYVKKRLGFQEAKLWDISATIPGDTIPRFTIEQSRSTITKALSPFGPEYEHELAQLLDPANGRMDIVPGENRKSGGFSKGFPGVTTVFFSGGFLGYYDDVRRLTHESGHAIHRQLMKNNHVLPSYANGPSYLFESFSIFNELLLTDYLYQQEIDVNKRRYFLEQFFEGKGMLLFVAAQEAALEQAMYEGIQLGTIQGADDLDSLANNINAQYSIWPGKHDELKMSWMTNNLFYEDPLYDINYVYGSLLAMKYYELNSRDPKGFIRQYIAMMKNGFDAPPAELLKQFLGIDLRDPNLITDAVCLIESKLSVLELEYSR